MWVLNSEYGLITILVASQSLHECGETLLDCIWQHDHIKAGADPGILSGGAQKYRIGFK